MRGTLLALVSLALLAGGDGDGFLCPPGCNCGLAGSGEVEAYCELPRAKLTFTGKLDDYVNIQCEGGEFSCSELPELPFGNATGRGLKVGMNFCAAPDSVGCAARALGGAPLVALTVHEAPARAQLLTPAQVRGLDRLLNLSMTWNNGGGMARAPIPTAALHELPALRRLTLRGAPLLLQRGAFSGASRHLDYLELSSAGLARLPAGALAPLAALRTLSLFKNRLTQIDADAFQGLDALENLTLEGNPLHTLHALALRRAPRLQVLRLFQARFERLDAQLAGLPKLQKLELTDNRVELTLGPGALADLPALTALDLSAARLRDLPGDLLTNSTALHTLILAKNQLSSLPAGLFRDQYNLEKLDLSGNELAALPGGLFSGLAALTQLSLADNRLVELASGMLTGVAALRSLDASRNRLRRVDGRALVGASALDHLNLSRNRLRFPALREPGDDENGHYEDLEETSLFNPLTSLRTLDLSHNLLRSVPSDISDVHTVLETLDLSHNRITQLYQNIDTDWIADVTVDLRHNNISAVHLTTADGPRRRPAQARILLDDNPFDCDCRLFPFAQRLRGLMYSGFQEEAMFNITESAKCSHPKRLLHREVLKVRLEEFSCQILANNCAPACSECTCRPATPALELTCPSQPPSYKDPHTFGVKFVDLRLHSAPALPLSLPEFVRKLDLSGIGLEEIPFESAPDSLKILDLSDNNLTEMSVKLLELPNNLTFLLGGNPFVCDCWHSDHISAMLKHRDRIENFTNLKCSDGNLLWKVNDKQLCNTFHAGVLGGLLAFIGLLVAVAAVVLYRYSLEVKVFLFSRGWCSRWVHEEDLDKDKTFDAFLSFSHEDEEFVIKELLPGLETGPSPFKICIHYRDWIAGEWIPAQIARSVDQSRRTVVVLSNNFLNSVWGRLEFRAAHMSAVQEHRSRVVVLLLDDVTTNKELDAELRAYLSTNTYLKWGDPWFWERLRYALPHRREERLMRKAGGQIARKLIGGKGAGGLDTQLTPEGKIVNAAAIQNAPKLDAGVIATVKV